MSNTIINVIIEVSKDSNLKYEYDSTETKLQLDRILPYQLKYPFNYGYVPDTIGSDGQPLDVILLLDESLPPGTKIKCKIIGGFKYSDEKGKDGKLIVCPANDVDNRFIYINDISNLKPTTLNKIRYFFENYKNNLNIDTKLSKFLNRVEARKMYEKYR
jgi:inorganic pyrophosphatase